MAELVKGILVILALSVILAFVSHALTSTTPAHLTESVFNQYATVRGEPFVLDGKAKVIQPFYNRILVPSVFVFLTKILRGWTDVQTFGLVRFLSFIICLFAIYVATYRRCKSSPNDVMIVLSAIALSMIPTFSHPWVHTSDIFDLTFCLFMFLYLTEEKFMPAFLVACLTAVNRETGAFAAVAYVCIAFGTQKLKLIAVRAGLIGLVPYLGAILIRKLVLGDRLPLASTGQWYTALSYNFGQWVEAVTRPSPTGWPMLLFAMMVFPWLVFLSRNSTTVFKVRVGAAFCAIFAITALVGINYEVRTFIPCVALLIGCALASRAGPHPVLTGQVLDGSKNLVDRQHF